jgi:hypothetical protein
MTASKQDAHETVTSYLSSLVWDGTPRLDRWLIDYETASQETQFRDKSDLGRSAPVKT